MHAKLFTRDKRFVADVELPQFNPPAEAVYWGQRFFIYDKSQSVEEPEEPLLYTEGMVFYIPVTTREPAGA